MFRFYFLDKRKILHVAKQFFTSTSNAFNNNLRNNNSVQEKVHTNAKVDVYENFEILKRIKEKSTLKNSLKEFREIVKKKTVNKGYNFYCGWPPVNRIKITTDEKIGNFGRSIFIFNRVTGVGKVREPNLCICCKNKNILLFNKQEFEALTRNMNFLKHELQEFKKKI